MFANHTSFTLLEEIADPERRFLLVKGHVGSALFSLMSYYAPKQGQTAFFVSIFPQLGPHLVGSIVCGGDSNIALDQCLDKSKPMDVRY